MSVQVHIYGKSFNYQNAEKFVYNAPAGPLYIMGKEGKLLAAFSRYDYVELGDERTVPTLVKDAA